MCFFPLNILYIHIFSFIFLFYLIIIIKFKLQEILNWNKINFFFNIFLIKMKISNKTHFRPHSTGKLIIKKPQNRRINILNKKLENNSNKTTINRNKEILDEPLIDKINHNKYKKIPNIFKCRHLNSKIFSNLTSNQPKGIYTYETINSFNNSNSTRRSYLEDEKIPKSENRLLRNQKKFFLTTQNKIFNVTDELSNINTIQTIENEKEKEKENNSERQGNNNNRFKKIKFTLKNILSKNNKLLKIKHLRRDSMIDRLLIKITNPEECLEEFIANEKPGDKYIKFKKQIQRNQNKKDKILLNFQLETNKGIKEIKRYHSHLAKIEYELKTKYNKKFLEKYKNFLNF